MVKLGGASPMSHSNNSAELHVTATQQHRTESDRDRARSWQCDRVHVCVTRGMERTREGGGGKGGEGVGILFTGRTPCGFWNVSVFLWGGVSGFFIPLGFFFHHTLDSLFRKGNELALWDRRPPETSFRTVVYRENPLRRNSLVDIRRTAELMSLILTSSRYQFQSRERFPLWFRFMGRINLFTAPKSAQFVKCPPAASPEMQHPTVWRTWLHSLLRWKMIIPILTTSPYVSLWKVGRTTWEWKQV